MGNMENRIDDFTSEQWGEAGAFAAGLECQNPVTAGSVDLLGNLGVASHGIDADDGRLEFQAVQQAGQGGQFVGLVSAEGLADAEARLADPSSQQVQTVTACFGIFNSTIDLAIDREARQLTDHKSRVRDHKHGQ